MYSINWPSFIVWLSLFCDILFVNQVMTSWILQLTLFFLIKPFFLHDQKVMTKTKISWERKELLRRNIFHHFYRAFNEANNTIYFGRWESDFKLQLYQNYMDYDYTLELQFNWIYGYGYILQLLEMEKKKIVVLTGSLLTVLLSFISAFTAVWNIRGKLKEKLKYIH